MQPRLLLASTSPYRSELLRRLGLQFEARAPLCDEEALKRVGEDPAAQATRLALAKAQSLAATAPDAFILGGDQLVELDGEILGKPHSAENAVAQLTRMRGKTHRLLTAFALVCPGDAQVTHLDTHHMRLRALGDAEIRRYVAHTINRSTARAATRSRRSASACASASRARTSARSPALPLMALCRVLRERGFQLP
jgi:septum formation protein